MRIMPQKCTIMINKDLKVSPKDVVVFHLIVDCFFAYVYLIWKASIKAFTCSKSTMETLEQCVKYAQS